jgi:hypothetical protein
MNTYLDGVELMKKEGQKIGIDFYATDDPNMVSSKLALPHKLLSDPLLAYFGLSSLNIGEVRNSKTTLPFAKVSILFPDVVVLDGAKDLLNSMNAANFMLGKVLLVGQSLYYEQSTLFDLDGKANNSVVEKFYAIALDAALQIRDMIANNQSFFSIKAV